MKKQNLSWKPKSALGQGRAERELTSFLFWCVCGHQESGSGWVIVLTRFIMFPLEGREPSHKLPYFTWASVDAQILVLSMCRGVEVTMYHKYYPVEAGTNINLWSYPKWTSKCSQEQTLSYAASQSECPDSAANARADPIARVQRIGLGVRKYKHLGLGSWTACVGSC